MNPYQVLGLPRGAPMDEVRKRYHELARKWHPDINKSADAERRFREATEAYDLIQKAPSSPRALLKQPLGDSLAWGALVVGTRILRWLNGVAERKAREDK